MQSSAQLEFLDFSRERVRPAGGGQDVDGFFVFNAHAQTPDRVAYTIGKTPEHVYHLIDEGAFPNAIDTSTRAAARACWSIPRNDVINFIRSRKADSF